MRLVYENGLLVEPGDTATTIKREKITVISITEPYFLVPDGRIFIEFDDGFQGDYKVDVIKAHWIE